MLVLIHSPLNASIPLHAAVLVTPLGITSTRASFLKKNILYSTNATLEDRSGG